VDFRGVTVNFTSREIWAFCIAHARNAAAFSLRSVIQMHHETGGVSWGNWSVS